MADETITPGGIHLPPGPPRDTVVWMTDETRRRFHAIIRGAMEAIDDALGEFEQTCHGSIGPHDIGDVFEALAALWNGRIPDDSRLLNRQGWLVSEASQRIRNLMKADRAG